MTITLGNSYLILVTASCVRYTLNICPVLAPAGFTYMNDTKAEILALLKRNGGHSVNELAATLDLAPITIRQHMTRLERDGLLLSEPQTNGTGRPHYVFRLSPKAQAQAFPYRSDRIVELLIR